MKNKLAMIMAWTFWVVAAGFWLAGVVFFALNQTPLTVIMNLRSGLACSVASGAILFIVDNQEQGGPDGEDGLRA